MIRFSKMRPGSSGSQRNRRAVDPDLQIQLPVIGERIDSLAGQRIDGVQIPARGDQNAAVLAVLALPVVRAALPADSAPAAAARAERMHPQFFAGGRVQRDQRSAFGRDVRDVIHHQRTEHGSPVRRRVAPGHFELAYIRSVDLLQGRIVRAVRSRPGSPSSPRSASARMLFGQKQKTIPGPQRWSVFSWSPS